MIIKIAFNFVVYLFPAAFLTLVLKRRWGVWVTLAAAFLTYFGSGLICSIFSSGPVQLREMISLVAALLGARLIFRDQWGRVIFAVSAAWLSLNVGEVLLSVLLVPRGTAVTAVWFWSQPLSFPLRALLIDCLLMTLLLGAMALLMRTWTHRFTARDWLLFGFFPMSLILLLLLWFCRLSQLSEGAAAVWALGALAVSLTADAEFCRFFRSTDPRRELETRNAALAEELAAQKKRYAELAAQYRQVRTQRHDIANHVFSLQALLARGELGEAEGYAAALLAQYSALEPAPAAPAEEGKK